MKRSLLLSLVTVLLLSTAHRLPAPISEESPTPVPQQSAKAKRAITKPQTPSPQPKSQATPNRNPFDGTWVATLNNVPFVGTGEDTFVISGSGTSVIDKLGKLSAKLFQATCDGSTVRWTNSTCTNTLTPNPDGKTAFVTINCAGVFGIGVYNTATVFRKISP